MGFLPITLIFEILFMVFGFILLEAQLLGRIIGIGLWAFEIQLWTGGQVYLSDASGTVAIEVGASFTSVALIFPLLFFVFMWILSLVNAFNFVGRDFIGRKR